MMLALTYVNITISKEEANASLINFANIVTDITVIFKTVNSRLWISCSCSK